MPALPLLLSAFVAQAGCEEPSGPTLMVVTAADPRLRSEANDVEQRLRNVIEPRLQLLSATMAREALTAEGRRGERAKAVVDARIRLARAFDRFRELEDSAALNMTAEVTAQLSAVSQSPGAIALLAEAHLLAGAIFLARNRIDGAQARLRRALQLNPAIRAPPTRYAPRVRAELAALRGDPGPSAVLEVTVDASIPDATVFVDGRSVGPAPARLTDIPAGRHLVRVSAPGRLSFHTSVRLEPTRPSKVTARLLVDPEVDQISRVARWLVSPPVRAETVSLLARRAESDSVLLAEIRLSDQRGTTATATRAVVLRMEGRPPQAASLTTTDLRRALDALLRCDDATQLPSVAPALVAWPEPKPALRPVPERPAWWTKPWVWAVFALVTTGAAAAAAAARNAEGPPDSVEITLVPRP